MKDINSPCVKVFRTVYKRDLNFNISVNNFLFCPDLIYKGLGIENPKEELLRISKIKDKVERNQAKRNFMPAVDFSETGVLCIDIDNVSHDKRLRRRLITKLKKHKHVFAVIETASGNLAVMFKYECDKEDFKKLYNRTYLSFQLNLDVEIDYLPEVNRLRYVALGKVFYFNEYSLPLTELYHGKVATNNQNNNTVEVNTTTGKRVIYKSL